MRAFLKEFKEFAVKGNVMDLAIGVIIGAAFGKIVTSLVNDIIMPLFGTILGSEIAAKTATVNGAIIKWGAFVQSVVDFLIVAFVIFLVIKAINRFKKPAPVVEVVVEPTKEEVLLTEIRDLLKNK